METPMWRLGISSWSITQRVNRAPTMTNAIKNAAASFFFMLKRAIRELGGAFA